MKKTLQCLTFLACVISLISACKKDNDSPAYELSLLPPATQTGANTFGCLAEGKACVPYANLFTGLPYDCAYVSDPKNGYCLFLSAFNNSDSQYNFLIAIEADSIAIQEGQTLKFGTRKNGHLSARCDLNINSSFSTAANLNGQLHITKFDQTKRIISGTFFFDAVDFASDTLHVTDGRFDMQYTP